MPLRRALLMVMLLAAPLLRAQAGPPFLTDDPETPGNHHWEINVGFLGAHHSGDAGYELPDFDINYGWGDRIQLKYELPIALEKDDAGPNWALGNSLLGVKWRFYQKMQPGEKEPRFSVSTYPQLLLENPTNAASRGVVDHGPQFLLPVEFNARLGWLRYDGEVGHWFSPNTPDQWIGGFLVGHEFSERFEAYSEIYTIEQSTAEAGEQRQRQDTLGLGARYKLTDHVGLMAMWGRSFHAVHPDNGEANYVGYIGLQFLFGPKDAETEPSAAHPLIAR